MAIEIETPQEHYPTRHALSCVLMRAGTSKGLFIHRKDLPEKESEWGPHLISALGSRNNDAKQVDGVGGGSSTTSKVAVISLSNREDADVDFTFVQVAVGKESVDFSGNCGNMSSGVGPFAVQERLVTPKPGQTEIDVRIFNTNTSRVIVETVELDRNGDFKEDGDFIIPGVKSSGSEVKCSFVDPAGSMAGSLFPSGLPTAPDTEIGFQPPPPSKGPLDKIRKGLVGIIPLPELGEKPVIYNPVITVLTGYLETIKPGALDEAVHSAYQQIPQFMDKLNISDARSFLDFANDLLKWVPHENYEGKDIYDILCMFYFIIDQPPLANLQTAISPDQVGQPLTWLSSWIVVYAQLIGLFMDSPASLTKESLESFSQKNSPKYNYDEALVPEGGFRTFNQFFSRHLKPGVRPIAEPENDRVIVYPADCTYDNSVANQNIVNIESDGVIMIKNLPWTISSLLQGSEYADEFHGGVWMHAFLNTFNYHRQHAPVAGEVLEAKNIQGAAYMEVNSKCEPMRVMCGPDAPDTPGYQFLQTRGMIIIDNPVLGKVAVLPIGMAQVSSVKITIQKGDRVEKGQEISYFQFGGSDVICVFQSKAGLRVEDFVASSNNTYSKYGTILARAPQK